MGRRRQLIEPPHHALRRSVDACARIGEPPVPPELQAGEGEDAAQPQPRQPRKDQRRGAGGRFS